MSGIAIVTPALNGAAFLSRAMDSILSQRHPALEYVVVDGGSSDGSQALVEREADRLHWWASEPDRGPYDAINKGFAHTGAGVMGWLNADDLHLPWTLSIVGELFARFPEIEWLTSAFPLVWDAQGRAVGCHHRDGFSRAAFARGAYLPGGDWYATSFVQQESTFWRRDLWERCGAGLDLRYGLAADFDLWMRFSKVADLYAVEVPLAGFRSHGGQRSSDAAGYLAEARASFQSHGGRPYSRVESALHRALHPRLPRSARRWATRHGLRDRRPVCVHGGPGRGWFIEER